MTGNMLAADSIEEVDWELASLYVAAARFYENKVSRALAEHDVKSARDEHVWAQASWANAVNAILRALFDASRRRAWWGAR